MPTTEATARKLRGGYYTPAAVARWLVRWAIRSGMDRVLEPSCGDGVFVEAAAAELVRDPMLWPEGPPQLVGVEFVDEEAQKARERARALLGGRRAEVVHGDFFDWLGRAENGSFDVVLGNPPFLRYQNFPEPSRGRAMEFMRARGLRPNRLTNLWVPFVVAGAHLLAEGGRLAMVAPAELLQVTYAGQLRQLLADSFRRITICACNEMFFEGAQQEVVLLLAEGKWADRRPAGACDISLIEAAGVEELLRSDARRTRRNGRPKRVQHDAEKWLKYFLDAAEIDFMRSLRGHDGIVPLSEHGSVDVGVVTGNNAFFVLDKDQVAAHDLADFTVPLIGRSAQLSGAVITRAEFQDVSRSGKPVFLLHLAGRDPAGFADGLRRWIASGEAKGVHLGFKCRIREPWYKVPAVWEPDCFFFRQIHDFPRVVANRAGATSTDTIHRLRAGSPAVLASSLYTHLTAASAEIEGRSYGGGVLELEPTEAERLLVPRQLRGAMPLEDVDRLVRAGRLEEVLEHNDRAVLRQLLGLGKAECVMLKRVWTKMRDRRIDRRRV